MSNLSGSQKPYKVWSADRQKRKSITAGTLNEFRLKGAIKLGYDHFKKLKVTLESDGTEVEDEAYFQSAASDTIFLLLRENEIWLPPGIDALKSALSAIPQIVCDTINSLRLMNKAPTWSIQDEHGLITVTLQWEHLDKIKYLEDFEECSWKVPTASIDHPHASTSYAQYDKVYSSTFPRHSSSRSYLRGVIRNVNPALNPYRDTLPFKALSAEDFSIIDRGEDLSSAADLTSYCDFHCSSLHREGGSIKVSKSVGTSPILDRTTSPVITYSRTTSPFDSNHPVIQYTDSGSSQHTAITQTGVKTKKGPVRFKEEEKKPKEGSTFKQNISLLGMINGRTDGSSSEDSETETTEREEEQLSEKSLLLIDQLSIDQKKHLSIKDIGIILERLSSKIVDINKLERDKESSDSYNWLIKCTIKGDVLREIGVVYNGHYYAIRERCN